MDITNYESNKHLTHLREKDFRKYHGHFGDTCKDNLGGVIWKEFTGI